MLLLAVFLFPLYQFHENKSAFQKATVQSNKSHHRRYSDPAAPVLQVPHVLGNDRKLPLEYSNIPASAPLCLRQSIVPVGAPFRNLLRLGGAPFENSRRARVRSVGPPKGATWAIYQRQGPPNQYFIPLRAVGRGWGDHTASGRSWRRETMVAVAICCILVLLAVFIVLIIVVGQTIGEPGRA